MKKYATIAFIALLISSSAAHAQRSKIHHFKDWYISCDNTRRCEAEGFQTDKNNAQPVTLYFVREAGPSTPVLAKYQVVDHEGGAIGKLTLKVGKTVFGNLDPEGELLPQQVSKLLPQLLDAPQLTLSDSKTTWILSLAGMKAALLKMDELQGRVGTQGALIRKGDKPESLVLPPVPAPVIKPAKLVPNKPTDDKLLQPILQAVKDRSCWEDMADEESAYPSIHRLSNNQVVVMRTCGRGAYQTWQNFWIANDKPPYSPKPVRFTTATGEMEEGLTEAEFEQGVISTHGKGRGLADCLHQASWVWTGQVFQLSEEQTSSSCRGIPGGGFGMRLWTAG